MELFSYCKALLRLWSDVRELRYLCLSWVWGQVSKYYVRPQLQRKPLASSHILHSLDGQQYLLLVTQLNNAYILKVFPCELRYILHSLVTLLVKCRAILLKSKQTQPFFHGALGNKIYKFMTIPPQGYSHTVSLCLT